VGRTICNPQPRPIPAIIWKKTHLTVAVVGSSVVRRPVPMDANTPLAIAHGR